MDTYFTDTIVSLVSLGLIRENETWIWSSTWAESDITPITSDEILPHVECAYIYNDGHNQYLLGSFCNVTLPYLCEYELEDSESGELLFKWNLYQFMQTNRLYV